MYKRGELKGRRISKISPAVHEIKEESVSQIMKDTIIKRGPDKMMQIQDNFLILAWRNDIIVINLRSLGILDDTDVTSNFKLITLENN